MKMGQKGFGVLEILIVIVVAGLIAGSGWYVWHRNKTQNATSTTPTSTTTAKKAEKCTEKTGYLTVKEVCVRFKLTDTISDATYYYESGGTGVSLSLKRFDNIKGAEKCVGAQSGSLAWLSWAKPGDDNNGSPWTKEELDLGVKQGASVKLGDKYYGIAANKYSCNNPTDDPNTLKGYNDAIEAAKKAFVGQTKSLELATD